MYVLIMLTNNQNIYRWQRVKPRISKMHNVQETQITVSKQTGKLATECFLLLFLSFW